MAVNKHPKNYYLYCKKADFDQIAKTHQISPLLARILRNRDITGDEAIAAFLHAGKESLYDPFLLKGMTEGISLLEQTIKEGGAIRIIGDYDCDGICSSYLLKTYLQQIGAQADVRLPDRMKEGYGMNADMVREAAADGISLIITCDNGVSCYEAAAVAKELQIRLVITDHHEVPLPLIEADAVINPKQPDCPYPFKEICGAGVAYKFICALDQHMQNHQTALLEDLLTFAGLATIADVVPLVDENRIFAKEGIWKMRQTKHIGLRALFETRKINPAEMDSYHVGFLIAPCLNSAGRLQHADLAYRLLESHDAETAHNLAEELSGLNDKRKEMTVQQYRYAEKTLDAKEASPEGLQKILVLYLPEAHESIAGIVAGRLKEDYQRPAIVVTSAEDGYKGSGRSVDAYPMLTELQKQAHLFSKLGGHAKAAGFSLAPEVKPEMLEEALNTTCQIPIEQMKEKTWIDMQIPFSYLTEAFVRELQKLEPFGLGNAKPLFAAKNVKIHKIMVLGARANVLKLVVEDETGIRFDAIRFGAEEDIAQTAELLIERKEKEEDKMRLSILFSPELNEFRGQVNVQLKIRDFVGL